jgi:hypothetical protein
MFTRKGRNSKRHTGKVGANKEEAHGKRERVKVAANFVPISAQYSRPCAGKNVGKKVCEVCVCVGRGVCLVVRVKLLTNVKSVKSY